MCASVAPYRTVSGSIPLLETCWLEVAQLVELSTVEKTGAHALAVGGIGAVAAHQLRMLRVRISIILFSISVPVGLAVVISPSHGGGPGSTPGRGTSHHDAAEA